MSKRFTHEISVGVTFLVAMAILSYYTIFMIQKKYHPGERFYVTANFKNVGGLRVKDKVYVNGVIAGNVEEITLEDYHVKLKLTMFLKFQMYENYIVRITSQTALGGKKVDIFPGSPIDEEGNEYAALGEYKHLNGQINDPFDSIGKLVDENHENITIAIRNLREITDKINYGQGTIGKLINKDDVHAQTDQLVKELRETVEDAREQAPITSFIRAALTAF